jgi:Acetyltransferases
MRLRRFAKPDAGRLWALNDLPNVGETADPTLPLELPIPPQPPPGFPFLADVGQHFLNAGGEFLVVEHGAHLVGMGGIRPNSATEAGVLHIRVHPATRRQGVGRLLMGGLEARARDMGFERLHLDTATNQPEAIAFYKGLGYTPAGTESNPNWSWTLQYFTRSL